MIEALAAIAVFITVAVAAVAILGPAVESRQQERRLRRLRAAPVPEAVSAGEVLRRDTTSMAALRPFFSNSSWADGTALRLERAGMRLRVSEYLLVRLLSGGIAAAAVILIAGRGWWPALLALLLGLVGFMLPVLYVGVRGEKRAARISKQLPEALQMVSNALRSGFALSQSIEMAADQLTTPISDELHHVLRDSSLGAKMDDALVDMARRAGSYDLDMAVSAILVQRSTGGNLAEVLDRVAETMRERERVRGEIHSLTSQQRLTGLVLAVYPVVLALLFTALAPDHMSILWTDPVGRAALAVGVALQILGAFSIRRILALDY